MEIILHQSEKAALEMFGQLYQHPQRWMSLTVQLAPLHREMVEHEGLSRTTLAKMRRISARVANSLAAIGLSDFTGKIFVFKDGDVLALFEKDSAREAEMMRELRTEFNRNNLIQFITVDGLTKRLHDIAHYIRSKGDTAVEYGLLEELLRMGDNLDAWTLPEQGITDMIRRKRRARRASSILVIEDDPRVSELLGNMLKDDHRVIAKSNAQDGILSYGYCAPNIVLLDITMPGMNGHETLKRILSLDADAYVVMISGQSSQDNVLTTYANGAVGFLCKPFVKEKLQGYIRECPSLISKMSVQAG